MTKITILGDIMCEPRLIQCAKKRESFGFHPLFNGVKDLLGKSDYVIGNLETPLAGKDAGYCCDLFSFNAPDEFAYAIKDAGIDFVTTANNHCLDRGSQGMLRTIDVLDSVGLAHCGTSGDGSRVGLVEINGIRIAIVCGTYGTNYSKRNNCLVSNDCGYYVNLLRDQSAMPFYKGKNKTKKAKPPITYRAIRKLYRFAGAPEWKIQQLQKPFHIGKTTPYADDCYGDELPSKYTDDLIQDLFFAKANADFVILYPHIGGQFNPEPGTFSKSIIKMAADSGMCDVVVASHSHVIQRTEIINGVNCFYSLGNFSMSPNSYYLPDEANADFGLALHLYLDGKRLSSIGVTILKISEARNCMMKVLPIHCIDHPSAKDRETVKGILDMLNFKLSDVEQELLEEYKL